MTKQLLSMVLREVKEFPVCKYDSLRSTVNILKRNGKGEWQTCMGGFKGERTLTVRRTK